MAIPVEIVFVLFLHSLLFADVTDQSCSSTSRYTQPNFILKDHVNKTIPGVESSEVCIEKCQKHTNCHSTNYYEASSICEVNDANHVSNPESFVPSSYGGEYQNYHERPTDTCSAKLCSDKYLCTIDDDKDNLYRCCSPAEIALYFPRVSTDDYLVVEKPFARNLTSITISLWLKMANKSVSHPVSSHVPLSYALNDEIANEITVEFYTNKVFFAVDNTGTYEKVSTDYFDDEWHHFCLTWNGISQIWAFYADSNSIIHKNWKNPQELSEGGALVIGQEQDDYISAFQTSQSFMGYINKVDMWDRAFTSSEVKNLYNTCAVAQEGNVIKWSDLYAQKKYGKVALVCVNSCG